MSSIEDIHTRLNDVLAKAVSMGLADTFYHQNRVMLSHYEIVMAEYLADQYPAKTRVLELGCGFGQLSIALAYFGFDVQGVEGSPPRVTGSKFFKGELPDLPYKLVEGYYPAVEHGPFDVLVGTNLVSGFYDNWNVPQEEKIPRLLQGKDALLNLRLWWTVREGADEQEALARYIESFEYKATQVGGPVWHFKVSQ